MRKSVLSCIIVGALAAPSTALAGGDPYPPTDPTLPPAAATLPAPAPVTNITTAQNFVRLYVARNAYRLLNTDRRNVRVTDVNAGCLQHPAIATRFGCAFTLRAAVIQQRTDGWDDWGQDYLRSLRSLRNDPPVTTTDDPTIDQTLPAPTNVRRYRVRTFGCLGAARVIGGANVRPAIQIAFSDCARVRNGDWVAPEPLPAA